MRFEWNEAKNRINRKKHGIDFSEAQQVFDDPYHVAFVERVTDAEERWQAIGSIDVGFIVVVVHTYREEQSTEVVRIISSRLATRRERKIYAEAIA